MTMPLTPELPDERSSSTVTVKPLDNGPLQIEGPLRVVDQAGTAYDLGEQGNIYLCRCGGSAAKPFCDGTHAALGFVADGRANR